MGVLAMVSGVFRAIVSVRDTTPSQPIYHRLTVVPSSLLPNPCDIVLLYVIVIDLSGGGAHLY